MNLLKSKCCKYTLNIFVVVFLRITWAYLAAICVHVFSQGNLLCVCPVTFNQQAVKCFGKPKRYERKELAEKRAALKATRLLAGTAFSVLHFLPAT